MGRGKETKPRDLKTLVKCRRCGEMKPCGSTKCANCRKQGLVKQPGRKPFEVKYDPDVHCGARAKHSNAPCLNPKGYDTGHLGEGRCKFHGGASPIKHGRYSTISKNKWARRQQEILEDLEGETNPTDLLPDLAFTRARLIILQEREETDYEMLKAWHESYTGVFRREFNALKKLLSSGDAQQIAAAIKRIREVVLEMPPKPNQIWKPYEFVKAVSAIAQLVDKITSARERQQVPLSSVVDMQDKMALVAMRIARQELGQDKADKLMPKVAKAWLEISVEF